MSFSGARPMRTVVADRGRAAPGSPSGSGCGPGGAAVPSPSAGLTTSRAEGRPGVSVPSPLTAQLSTGPSAGLPSRTWHSPSISIRSARWPPA